MSFRPIRVLLIAACLLAFPSRAPAPLVYHAGEGWVHELAGGASDFPREVVLRQQVAPQQTESTNLQLYQTNTPFLKEPELGKRGVFRSVLKLGKDTHNAIALIWDQPNGKLYLDLNQNLDLTDDPAGVLSTTNKGSQQLFDLVTIPLKIAEGPPSTIVDLRLTSSGVGRGVQAQVTSRSLWEAKVGLPGQEWQVAALDDFVSLDGPVFAKFLLLRPWAERTNSLSLRDPTSGFGSFPNQLFWLGKALHVERRFETQGENSVCKLELTPQQPPLTEMKLTGESIYYAVLHATNGYTAVLWEPSGTLKVPQGIYTASAVWLKKGAAKAYRLAYEPLLLNATVPTNVVLGGPLTNSVILTRQGQKLNMSYQIVGADGGSYRLAQQDRTKPPEFTVYHGGKKVQSGKFEFG